MREEFDVNLTPDDMYRFNMYHTYHGFHGIFSIVMAILLTVFTVMNWGKVNLTYSVICIFAILLLLFFMPLNLKNHAKIQLKRYEALRNTQHFTVDERGVTISQNGEEATLEWKQVYKVVETKSNLLIYSTRVNAYVFPMRELGTHRDGVVALAKEHLKTYRLHVK